MAAGKERDARALAALSEASADLASARSEQAQADATLLQRRSEVAALRQRYGLPVLTPQAIDALQPDEIVALWREMTRRRRRWRVLFTG